MIIRRLTYCMASCLALIATISVSTASFLFVYEGEIPSELFHVE
jgi:cyclic lactone autoinducer peptide